MEESWDWWCSSADGREAREKRRVEIGPSGGGQPSPGPARSAHLVAAVVRLRAEPGAIWPGLPGGYLRGWLYDELLGYRLEGPGGLAEAAHEWRRPGVASVAALGARGPRWSSLDPPQPHELDLRISALDPLASERVTAALARLAEGEPVRLGATIAQATALALETEAHPLAGRAEPSELAASPPGERWGLAFLTPTAFATGDVRLPLPMPRSLVGSWLSRWDDFTGYHLGLNEDFLGRLDRWLELVEVDISTASAALFGPRRVGGFIGRVVLQASRRGLHRLGRAEAEPAARALSTLVRFAFFAGTGADTALGMGLTQPVVPSPARR